MSWVIGLANGSTGIALVKSGMTMTFKYSSKEEHLDLRLNLGSQLFRRFCLRTSVQALFPILLEYLSVGDMAHGV